jgi:hypothetical protein
VNSLKTINRVAIIERIRVSQNPIEINETILVDMVTTLYDIINATEKFKRSKIHNLLFRIGSSKCFITPPRSNKSTGTESRKRKAVIFPSPENPEIAPIKGRLAQGMNAARIPTREVTKRINFCMFIKN